MNILRYGTVPIFKILPVGAGNRETCCYQSAFNVAFTVKDIVGVCSQGSK